ncbi:MAG: anti-sigma factor antagonist [Anaerolineae bacterium]|nr:anti-sigma factor antagonist [Anaerolineae bacterium]
MAEERWLRIPASIDQIADARDFVASMAADAGLNERAIYHCEISVDEAVTNIIEHGYGGGDLDAEIEVGCCVEGGDFVIVVIDESPAFDPLDHADPDPGLALDDRLLGGWGIFFIKKMMDHVSYVYDKGRNKLLMRKALAVADDVAVEEIDGVARCRVAPGVWAVRPSGRLDSMTSQPLQAALQAQFEAGHTCVIVDMSQVTYISSSGLKALVGAWRVAQDRGGMVAIVQMQPRVREVFEMVGFQRIFHTFVTIQDAVTAIKAGKLGVQCAS